MGEWVWLRPRGIDHGVTQGLLFPEVGVWELGSFLATCPTRAPIESVLAVGQGPPSAPPQEALSATTPTASNPEKKQGQPTVTWPQRMLSIAQHAFGHLCVGEEPRMEFPELR